MSRNLVGAEVRRKRFERDWSQERLAEECQEVGWNVTRGHIAKIESGEVCVTDIDHLMLAAAFGVDMEDLMPRVCVNVKRKKEKGTESLFIAINKQTGGCIKSIMSPDQILADKTAKLLNGQKFNGHEICPESGTKMEADNGKLSA